MPTTQWVGQPSNPRRASHCFRSSQLGLGGVGTGGARRFPAFPRGGCHGDLGSLLGLARAAGLNEIVTSSSFIRFGPASLPESRVMRLHRLYPRSVVKEAAGYVLVPRPLSLR